jgi:hypothetical protein
MHHGYVDRVAIADSVLMDLLTLQQVDEQQRLFFSCYLT